MPIMLFVILALIFVILLIVVTNIVIVPQSMVYVCLLYTSWASHRKKARLKGSR